MAKTHYETLGLKSNCTAEEIRSAYRKLALKHHPDSSKDPRSVDLFIAITQAYNVLNDSDQRRSYDGSIQPKPKPQVPKPQPKPTKTPDKGPEKKREQVAAEVAKLTIVFSRGQHGEAETLARKILQIDGRQAVPYAVLGDIARARGNVKEAAKMYAFAVQMAPGNSVYQRRHEDLLDKVFTIEEPDATQKGVPALLAGTGMVLLSGIYLALSKETVLFPSIPLLAFWTLGLLAMTFLCGVIIGASLAIGGWLDHLSANASTPGKIAPPVALATVAFVSFWVAALLYFVLGVINRSFNVSTSRLVAAVACGVLILSVCAAISPSLSSTQVLLWSGNLMYLGSLAGWTVSDSFRKS